MLADETVALLVTRADGVYIDATAGGGGHAVLIASRLSSSGMLLAIDRDRDAVTETGMRLQKNIPRTHVIQGEFQDMAALAAGVGITSASGILLDLGLSSHQLDTTERGFSYHSDGPLDLRMDQEAPMTAADYLESVTQDELARVLFQFGEEKNSRRIAQAIITVRRKKPIQTTADLAGVILTVTNPRFQNKTLSRCFQALRIVVNDELGQLKKGLTAAVNLLERGGRVAVISYHSLEDRLVKQLMREWSQTEAGTGAPHVRRLTKKPIIPSAPEIAANPRARSAKLRVAEKL